MVFVFRHEGFGSPFAVLKARGWATGLSAGEGGSSFSARSFFTVGISLTDEGKSDCAPLLGKAALQGLVLTSLLIKTSCVVFCRSL